LAATTVKNRYYCQQGRLDSFVEVKYRSNDDTFSDDVTISPSRLLQMQRSAWGWIDETKWQGGYVLSSVELAGPNFTVLGFIENVI
jgi:Holliday junction resolvase-like predicted endonuclease